MWKLVDMWNDKCEKKANGPCWNTGSSLHHTTNPGFDSDTLSTVSVQDSVTFSELDEMYQDNSQFDDTFQLCSPLEAKRSRRSNTRDLSELRSLTSPPTTFSMEQFDQVPQSFSLPDSLEAQLQQVRDFEEEVLLTTNANPAESIPQDQFLAKERIRRKRNFRFNTLSSDDGCFDYIEGDGVYIEGFERQNLQMSQQPNLRSSFETLYDPSKTSAINQLELDEEDEEDPEIISITRKDDYLLHRPPNQDGTTFEWAKSPDASSSSSSIGDDSGFALLTESQMVNHFAERNYPCDQNLYQSRQKSSSQSPVSLEEVPQNATWMYASNDDMNKSIIENRNSSKTASFSLRVGSDASHNDSQLSSSGKLLSLSTHHLVSRDPYSGNRSSEGSRSIQQRPLSYAGDGYTVSASDGKKLSASRLTSISKTEFEMVPDVVEYQLTSRPVEAFSNPQLKVATVKQSTMNSPLLVAKRFESIEHNMPFQKIRSSLEEREEETYLEDGPLFQQVGLESPQLQMSQLESELATMDTIYKEIMGSKNQNPTQGESNTSDISEDISASRNPERRIPFTVGDLNQQFKEIMQASDDEDENYVHTTVDAEHTFGPIDASKNAKHDRQKRFPVSDLNQQFKEIMQASDDEDENYVHTTVDIEHTFGPIDATKNTKHDKQNIFPVSDLNQQFKEIMQASDEDDNNYVHTTVDTEQTFESVDASKNAKHDRQKQLPVSDLNQQFSYISELEVDHQIGPSVDDKHNNFTSISLLPEGHKSGQMYSTETVETNRNRKIPSTYDESKRLMNFDSSQLSGRPIHQTSIDIMDARRPKSLYNPPVGSYVETVPGLFEERTAANDYFDEAQLYSSDILPEENKHPSTESSKEVHKSTFQNPLQNRPNEANERAPKVNESSSQAVSKNLSHIRFQSAMPYRSTYQATTSNTNLTPRKTSSHSISQLSHSQPMYTKSERTRLQDISTTENSQINYHGSSPDVRRISFHHMDFGSTSTRLPSNNQNESPVSRDSSVQICPVQRTKSVDISHVQDAEDAFGNLERDQHTHEQHISSYIGTESSPTVATSLQNRFSSNPICYKTGNQREEKSSSNTVEQIATSTQQNHLFSTFPVGKNPTKESSSQQAVEIISSGHGKLSSSQFLTPSVGDESDYENSENEKTASHKFRKKGRKSKNPSTQGKSPTKEQSPTDSLYESDLKSPTGFLSYHLRPAEFGKTFTRLKVDRDSERSTSLSSKETSTVPSEHSERRTITLSKQRDTGSSSDIQSRVLSPSTNILIKEKSYRISNAFSDQQSTAQHLDQPIHVRRHSYANSKSSERIQAPGGDITPKRQSPIYENKVLRQTPKDYIDQQHAKQDRSEHSPVRVGSHNGTEPRSEPKKRSVTWVRRESNERRSRITSESEYVPQNRVYSCVKQASYDVGDSKWDSNSAHSATSQANRMRAAKSASMYDPSEADFYTSSITTTKTLLAGEEKRLADKTHRLAELSLNQSCSEIDRKEKSISYSEPGKKGLSSPAVVTISTNDIYRDDRISPEGASEQQNHLSRACSYAGLSSDLPESNDRAPKIGMFTVVANSNSASQQLSAMPATNLQYFEPVHSSLAGYNRSPEELFSPVQKKNQSTPKCENPNLSRAAQRYEDRIKSVRKSSTSSTGDNSETQRVEATNAAPFSRHPLPVVQQSNQKNDDIHRWRSGVNSAMRLSEVQQPPQRWPLSSPNPAWDPRSLMVQSPRDQFVSESTRSIASGKSTTISDKGSGRHTHDLGSDDWVTDASREDKRRRSGRYINDPVGELEKMYDDLDLDSEDLMELAERRDETVQLTDQDPRHQGTMLSTQRTVSGTPISCSQLEDNVFTSPYSSIPSRRSGTNTMNSDTGSYARRSPFPHKRLDDFAERRLESKHRGHGHINRAGSQPRSPVSSRASSHDCLEKSTRNYQKREDLGNKGPPYSRRWPTSNKPPSSGCSTPRERNLSDSDKTPAASDGEQDFSRADDIKSMHTPRRPNTLTQHNIHDSMTSQNNKRRSLPNARETKIHDNENPLTTSAVSNTSSQERMFASSLECARFYFSSDSPTATLSSAGLSRTGRHHPHESPLSPTSHTVESSERTPCHSPVKQQSPLTSIQNPFPELQQSVAQRPMQYHQPLQSLPPNQASQLTQQPSTHPPLPYQQPLPPLPPLPPNPASQLTQQPSTHPPLPYQQQLPSLPPQQQSTLPPTHQPSLPTLPLYQRPQAPTLLSQQPSTKRFQPPNSISIPQQSMLPPYKRPVFPHQSAQQPPVTNSTGVQTASVDKCPCGRLQRAKSLDRPPTPPNYERTLDFSRPLQKLADQGVQAIPAHKFLLRKVASNDDICIETETPFMFNIAATEKNICISKVSSEDDLRRVNMQASSSIAVIPRPKVPVPVTLRVMFGSDPCLTQQVEIPMLPTSRGSNAGPIDNTLSQPRTKLLSSSYRSVFHVDVPNSKRTSRF